MRQGLKVKVMSVENSAHIPNADEIIEKFGGIRPMATKLGVPVTTVQGWKKRNAIPVNRREQIILSAIQNDIEVGDLLDQTATTETFAQPESTADIIRLPQSARVTAPVEQPEESEETVEESPAAAAPTPSEPEASVEDVVAELGLAPMPEKTPRRLLKSFTLPQDGSRAANATWLAVMILSLAVIIGLLAMGPGVKRLITQEKRIASMETELGQLDTQVRSVQNENSILKGLVPANLQNQIEELRTRAVAIEDTVDLFSLQAASVTSDILNGKAGALEARLKTVESQIQKLAGSAGSQTLAGFLQKMRALQGSPAGQNILKDAGVQLQTLFAGGAIANDQQVDAKLQSIEKNPGALKDTMTGLSGNDLKAASMLLALTQFRSTMARENVPFDKDLALMRDLAARDNPELLAAIDRLAPQAKKGVLSPAGVSKQFRGLAGEIVAASLAGENVSISEKMKARLHDVFQIQKDGVPVTGTATQKAVEVAQAQLDAGDIQGAIVTLQTLDGAAAEKAAPWMDAAQMSLLAEKVKDQLTKTVSAKISLQPFAAQSPGLDLRALTQGVVQSMGGAGMGGTMIYDPASGYRALVPAPKLMPEPLKPATAR